MVRGVGNKKIDCKENRESGEWGIGKIEGKENGESG